MKRISTIPFFLAPLLFLETVGAQDDSLVLEGGSVLSGKIIQFSPSEGITFLSQNASSPFLFKSEKLKSITFSAEDKPQTDFSEILILNNGDHIPGTISTLDKADIGFETNFSAPLKIQRAHARSIDFGVRPQRLVFSGPGKISDWHNNENWESSGKAITSSASGVITRPDILPAQFILRFRLEWEGNPSLRFYFCDDLLKTRGESDRYYFEFNSAGMQLKRENSHDSQRWSTIASIRRRPNTFPDSRTDIELRVDRAQGLIYIYLNGKSEGHYRDHFENFPTGSGIMIQSLAGGDLKNIISNIEIYDWDAVSQIRGDEGHEDEGQDSLISSAGERFSGSADTLIQEEDDSTGIVFSSPHTDDSFTIPKNRISTLYFRKQKTLQSDEAADWVVILANKGKVQLSEISMDTENLWGNHPLLGNMRLNRSIIESVERLQPNEEKDN